MNLFFEICHYAIGSLVIGVIATIAGVALMFFVIRGFYRSATFTLPSIIAGGLLFILLGYQFVTMSGAIGLKYMCDDFREYIDNLMPMAAKEEPLPITEDYSKELIAQAVEEFPIIGNFVSSGYFIGYNTHNIADAMADELNTYLNKYIWESIGWSILFIAIASFVIVKTMDIRNQAYAGRTTYRHGSHSTGARGVRGHNGRRVSDF